MPISIELHDIATIGLLVFLEGILSIDNAVVLALLANKLPKEQQKKALSYGLIGAFVFRFIALFMAAYLMKWNWVKFVGGGYLIYVALSHWVFGDKKEDDAPKAVRASFWKTVIVIELTDIAFAIDSILAAVAITTKFWVVFTGGVIGLVVMRFAASMFIGLLRKFPAFEVSAYILVLIIGVKLVIAGFQIPGIDFHSSSSPASWIFWIAMLSALAYGFLGHRKRGKSMVDKLKKQEKALEQFEN